ncbi:MAG: ATP-binding cassette domain-containing protein, partial [Lachnospiraceae bacterium]|nr:ATP-binding cassette domain-containing protein [Lachnospiraceae bacterium]
MSENNEKKVLLSLKDVDVKFNVRGRTLQAIRNVSLDVYENESLAIVGESGSGKSVLTKTIAGMLDSNGYISHGSIILSDDEISKTDAVLSGRNLKIFNKFFDFLNKNSNLEVAGEDYKNIVLLEKQINNAKNLTDEEIADFESKIKEVQDKIVDRTNYLWTLDKKNAEDAKEIEKINAKLAEYEDRIKRISDERSALEAKRVEEFKNNSAKYEQDRAKLASLKAEYEKKVASATVSAETKERNKKIAYEVVLSIGRYPFKDQIKFERQLKKAFITALKFGEDLTDATVLNKVFET